MINFTKASSLLAVLVVGLIAVGCAGLDGGEPTRAPTEPVAPPTAEPSPTPVEASGMLKSYVNEPYGFSLRYPDTWDVMEGRNYLSLNRGTVNLVIGYRRATDDANICCREQFPEGELVEGGAVACAGEEIERALVTCDGLTKAVLYRGNQEVAVGDLRFLFYLEDFNADYQAAAISPDMQAEVDRVIGSLETFEPVADSGTATPRPTKLPPTPTPTAEPTATATPVPPTATPAPAVARAQPEGANVRSGPGTEYGLEGTLEGGEDVVIVGRYRDWWRIVYRDHEAWVYDGVVETRNTEHVPEVEAAPTQVPSSPARIPTAAPPSAIQEERWIDVDISEQRLTAYENGEAVRSTLVSTGLPRTPTVLGQFRIWIKLRYDDMEGGEGADAYYLEDVPYVMYFYQGYGLHGTFWHSNFGYRMSHGCVNLPTSEAEWVFNFADVGTLVNVRE